MKLNICGTKCKSTLNYLFGEYNLNRFRKDFKDACNRNLDFDKNNLSKKELVSIVKERPSKAKNKHKKIRFRWAVFGSLLALTTGLLGYNLAAYLLTTMGILIALEIPYRIAIINATAYTVADKNMSKEDLVYRKRWNALIFKTSSLAVVLLPALLLKLGKEETYNSVIENVEEQYLKDVKI